MKLFEINTTAYEEENLLIITDLTDGYYRSSQPFS